MKYKINAGIFCFLILALSIANFLTPDKKTSESENRELAQMPEFSFSAFTKGSFTSDFDTYVTDQFVERDKWVSLKTLLERLSGKRSTGGVYFAEDDYLIEMFDTVDYDRFIKNTEFVNILEKRLAENGVKMSTMLVPSVGYVLEDYLPANSPEINQGELLAAAAANIDSFIDVSGILKANRDSYLYYKTDHHWTSDGAYLAYTQFCLETGIEPLPITYFEKTVLSESFFGTTYSKANYYFATPDTIVAYSPVTGGEVEVNYNDTAFSSSIYEMSYLDTKDKYSVFLNSNQAKTVIKTQSEHNKRILIIKDSYANAFVQFLIPHFSEIHVIDLRYFSGSPGEYAETYGMEEVLVLYSLKNFASDQNVFFLSR